MNATDVIARADELTRNTETSGLLHGLPREAYLSEDFFRREQETLFRQGWVACGLCPRDRQALGRAPGERGRHAGAAGAREWRRGARVSQCLPPSRRDARGKALLGPAFDGLSLPSLELRPERSPARDAPFRRLRGTEGRGLRQERVGPQAGARGRLARLDLCQSRRRGAALRGALRAFGRADRRGRP